jgi:hypothetical protein
MRRATGVLVLAAVVAVAGGSLTGGAAAAAPPARPMAAYEWHRAGTLPLAEVRPRLAFLRGNGFRTVYLEVGNWVDAADQPRDNPDRQRQLDVIRYHLRRYVAAASGYGLAVQAVGGGPSWTGDLGYLGQLLVKLAGDYNATVAAGERLQGVQLDIEPYVEGGWHDDTQTSLSRYLKTVWAIVTTYRRQLTRPAAASSSASPSRSGSTASATPRARSPSTAPPSRPPATWSTCSATSPGPTW